MKLYGKGLLSLTAVTFLLTSCGSETKGDAAANVTVNKDNLEDTAGFLAVADGGSSDISAPSGGWDDDEEEEDDDECNCDYCATVRGSGVTASTDVTGQQILGLFQVGFPHPLNWERITRCDVSGTLESRAVFATGPATACPVPDINNPSCGSQSQVSDIRCLEVFTSPIGKTAWFSGLVTSATPDPRVDDAQNAQLALEVQQRRAAVYGSLLDSLVGPDSRTLITTIAINLIEGVDNPIAPVGEITSIQPLISCGNLTPENICELRELLTTDQVFLQLVCNPVATPCTGVPPANRCVQPTPNANGIGFANPNELACYIANTQIQWLDAAQMPFGAPVANTIANVCNPPAGIEFTNLAYRNFISGGIKITRHPAQ